MNDRTKRQSTDSDFSDGGLRDDLRSFLEQPSPAAGKPPRTRNLKPTFRAIPTNLPAHDSDGRAARSALAPARAGSDQASAHSARADDSPRRRAALQQTRPAATADHAAEPAAASAGTGRVRGWGAGRQAESSAALPTGSSGAKGAALPGAKGKPGRPKKESTKTGPTVKLPAAIARLVPKSDDPKVPPKLVPTETERSNATRLFREIGRTFNENRKLSKTKAYAAFRHDLMDNLDTLIMGGALDLKEATTIITNLEQYTRETEAESTETPATILGRWLRMDAAEVAGLTVEAVEEPAEDEESGEEIEESQIML